MKSLKLFKRFYSSSSIVISKCHLKMEEKLKNIFYASVNAVKPSELITKKKLITLESKNDLKVLSIQNGKFESEFDVTEKKIHMGKS